MRRSLGFIILLLIISVPCLFAQDIIQTWDFETALDNWTSGDGGATIELSTEQALTGAQSVKLVGADDNAQINVQNDAFDAIEEGDVLAYNVWISTDDLALIDGCQIFFQDAGWGWVSQWVAASSLTGDAWTTLEYTMPAFSGPVNRIGFQLVDLDAASTPTIYIDDITVTRPPVNIISNGEFDNGETGWEGWINNSEVTVDVAIDTTSKLSGKNSYRLILTNASDVTYYIQRNINCPIELGHKYQVSFQAVASDAAGDSSQINVLLEENGGDYAKRLNEIAVVDTAPKVFTYTVDYCPATDPGNQLKMHFGGAYNTGDTIWVDAIQVVDLGASMDIVVDGYCDPFYQTLTGPDDGYLQLRSYAYNNNGAPDDDADLSAKVWTSWDDEWFYLYEEVKDDTISMSSTHSYNNDGFEMKFDPVATDSVANSIYSLDMTAIYTDTATVAGEATSVPDSLIQWARRITTDGYVIEFAVKWEAITSSNETIAVGVGNVFGAAIQNHDNDNLTGVRNATVQWAAVLADAVWNTPKDLGTVKFLEDHKLQFIPSNNMTGVTNVIPYDGSDYDTAVDGKDIPTAKMTFNLAQNYPNPFNPTTMISYSIATQSNVRLSVFDILGREVAVLVNAKKAAGTYNTMFDGKALSSGVYFYRLQAGDKVVTQKMMLMK